MYKRMKSIVRSKFVEWYSEQIMTGIKSGKKVGDLNVDLRLSTLKPMQAGWIVHAFQNVKTETLKRGWVKAGIADVCKND